MNDMSLVIVPKSDQINADDLVAGPLTIRISEVDIRPGTEQPVSIHYEGDGGRPWKPCKSMSRVLVAAWGPDAKVYAGRSVTLYRDPTVKWGGMEVGGIRVSHLSHINKPMVLALTATKGSRKPYTVQPLAEEKPAGPDKARLAADALIARIAGAIDLAALEAITGEDLVKTQRAWLAEKRKPLAAEVNAAVAEKLAALEKAPGADSHAGEDLFPG